MNLSLFQEALDANAPLLGNPRLMFVWREEFTAGQGGRAGGRLVSVSCYADDGRLLRRWIYRPDGSLSAVQEGLSTPREANSGSPEDPRCRVEYDSHGRVNRAFIEFPDAPSMNLRIEKSYPQKNGTVTRTFASAGNLIAESEETDRADSVELASRRFDPTGAVVESLRETLDRRDAAGNWTRRTLARLNSETGIYHKFETDSRIIAYY
jgi:hypothetical protein